MAEQYKDKQGKFFILNWMDGSRTWFDSEEEAMKEYLSDKVEADHNREEFDKGVYKFLREYNNI